MSSRRVSQKQQYIQDMRTNQIEFCLCLFIVRYIISGNLEAASESEENLQIGAHC